MLGLAVTVLLAASALGAAVVAGVFLAFSTSVMPGLGRSGPGHAVPAMQAVNVAAVRPPLMLLLFGTLLVLLTTAAALLVARGWSTESWLSIAAFAIYGAGVVVVTAAGNVPLNNRLAGPLEPRMTAEAWRAYAGPWTRLNHVRTATAAGSAALLLIALVLVAGALG
jgi:uncharacterized membrane protein